MHFWNFQKMFYELVHWLWMCQKPTWRVELKNIFLSPDNNNWKCTLRNLSFFYKRNATISEKMFQWMPSKLETKLCLFSFSSEQASRRNQVVLFADIQILAIWKQLLFNGAHIWIQKLDFKRWDEKWPILTPCYPKYVG